MTSPALHGPISERRLAARFLALLAVAAAPAFGQSPVEAPDDMIKRVSVDVLAAVKTDSGVKSGDVGSVQKLVDAKILPATNFEYMTSAAVGRSWSKAAPDQQKQLIEGFKDLLVKTYSGALASAGEARVTVRPSKAADNATDTVVRTTVTQSSGDPIQLDYRLGREADGWKIHDVNVVGVWLVENYRTQFQQEITANGIDGLIKTLNSKR